ncbi:MAG TPA: L,D-transpeptidase [Cytophagaceae bacterium]|jgi:murein L,D-transpeptidase YafK|nr:L,D-transpeptidase [Cytophagaceae bacterium]
MKVIQLITLLFIAYTFSNGEGHTTDSVIVIKSQKSLKFLVDSLKINPQTLRFLVVKSKYKMSVWHDSLNIKTYQVVFGTNPIGDKLREGDRCTPEGKFKIISKYPHSSWSKFIWIDYPNADSWKKHNAAKKKGLIPQNATIGGEVGIHGVPEGSDYAIDQKNNWTWGCISLKTNDINEIYPYFNKSTVIEIRR